MAERYQGGVVTLNREVEPGREKEERQTLAKLINFIFISLFLIIFPECFFPRKRNEKKG